MSADEAHPDRSSSVAAAGKPRGLFRVLLESTPAWVLWWRADGTLGYVSPSSELVTGYPPSAFLEDPGLSLRIVHPDDRGAVSRHLAEVETGSGEAGECEYRITTSGGETRWIHHRCAPLIRGQAGVGRRAINQDITSLKGAAEALHESEARSRELFDHMNNGVAIYEALGDGEDFVFLDLNPAGQRLSHISRQEVVGRSVLEVFPGVREMGLWGALGRVWRSGRPEWLPVHLYRDERVSQWVQNYIFRLPSGQVVAVYHDVTERKEAEEELRLSEERYRRLFDEAAKGIALTDVETGTILDCNREFLTLTGYERTELVGHAMSMLHPSDRAAEPAIPRAGTREEQLVTSSGILRDVEVKASTIEVGGRTYLLGFYRDITQERLRQRERESTLALLRLLNERDDLREMTRRLAEYLELWSGCEAVGIRLREGSDFPYYETRGFSAEFVRAESSLHASPSAGRQESTGSPVPECTCGRVLSGRSGSFWCNSTTELEAREGDPRRCSRNRCNREGYESVALIPLRHGDEVIGLLQLNDRERGRFSGDLISFLEGAADQIAIAVAERQAKAALEESDRRFLDVSGAAGEFIWETDAERRVSYTSAQVEEILGYRPQDLLGLRPDDFLKPPSAEEVTDLLDRTEASSVGPVRRELQALTRSDRAVWLAVTAAPRRDTIGRLQGCRGVCLDITGRKHLEVELLQAQRLEAIGLLAGGLAHDFNNMLQIIIGSIAAVAKHVGTDPSIRSDLNDAAGAARKAADLTRQLLVFGRRQTLQPTDLDLNMVVVDLRKMLQRLVGEKVELEVEVAPAIDTVRADRGQIEQVLVNLCANARDAMPSGGRVTIATENVVLELDEHRIYPGSRAGRHVALTVSDTGEGMDQATRARVFEPFFTTKEPGRGTGLGLATVYGIVTQHGGRIDLDTEPGRGASFRICFPSTEGSAATAPAPQEGARGGSERVLICEDDPDVLKIGARVLRDAGYSVLTASDAEEALRILERREGGFDLALLDLLTPKGGGRVVMERIRESHPAARILYTSGHDDQTIAAELPGSGGAERRSAQRARLLRKPWDPGELLRAVREVLDTPRRA